MMKKLTIFLLCSVMALSENINGNWRMLGEFDMTTATRSKPFRTSASAPSGSCSNIAEWVQVTSTGFVYFCHPTTLLWTQLASGGGGTVTSVGLSLPTIFSVSGSPVTASGTLTASLATQSANQFLASPNGSSGVPAFRAIVSSDIPQLNQNTTGNAGTATALAADPAACPGGQYASDIAANGTLTCSTPAGGGGGATSAAALNTLAVSRAGNTLTIGANCSGSSPCNVRVGSTLVRIVSPGTAVLTAPGSGAGWAYVTNAGIVVGTNSGAGAVTCTGCTYAAGVSGYPSATAYSSVSSLTTTSGGWASDQDDRTFVAGTSPISAGYGMTPITDGLAADRTVIAGKFYGAGAPGSIPASTLADVYVNTSNGALYVCNNVSGGCNGVGAGQWVASGGGGGSTYAFQRFWSMGRTSGGGYSPGWQSGVGGGTFDIANVSGALFRNTIDSNDSIHVGGLFWATPPATFTFLTSWVGGATSTPANAVVNYTFSCFATNADFRNAAIATATGTITVPLGVDLYDAATVTTSVTVPGGCLSTHRWLMKIGDRTADAYTQDIGLILVEGRY